MSVTRMPSTQVQLQMWEDPENLTRCRLSANFAHLFRGDGIIQQCLRVEETFCMGDPQPISSLFNWLQPLGNRSVEPGPQWVTKEAHGTTSEAAPERGLTANPFFNELGKEIKLAELELIACTSRQALVEIALEAEDRPRWRPRR